MGNVGFYVIIYLNIIYPNVNSQNKRNARPRKMTTTLYRPVGLYELALIWDSGCGEFPLRLPHQPIFYPVTNAEYARQIARDWNTSDETSGYSGYVTRFEVATSYLGKFEPRTVGAAIHLEYWIPARELEEFNGNITGQIHLEAAYFGEEFRGYVPSESELRGKNAAEQFVFLANLRRGRSAILPSVIANNRKAVFLHSAFWTKRDFSPCGILPEEQRALLEKIEKLSI